MVSRRCAAARGPRASPSPFARAVGPWGGAGAWAVCRSLRPGASRLAPLARSARQVYREAIRPLEELTRFEQFYDESETIIAAAAEAFATREYVELGRLVDESHRLTVEKLGNTIPETAWLPRWARGQDDAVAASGGGRIRALAASAFGAGFGGSCWALVREDEAEAFRTQWHAAYEAAFPPKAGALERVFFVMAPGPGAFEL